MAEALLPEAIIRIRDKFPASKCLTDHWTKVKNLVKDGKQEEAEGLAKACFDTHPHLKVRNKVAVQHRIQRREYLKAQREVEDKVRVVLDELATQLERLLLNNSGEDGTVPFRKMNQMIDRAKARNTQAWAQIVTILKAGVRDSVWYGITITMDSAQAGLDYSKGLMVEAAQRAALNRTSSVFQTIFDRVKQRRINQKLFSGRRGIDRTGVPLSRRVWDIRDWHLRRIRGTISSGIADGRAASAMANDLKKMTVVGKISDKATLEPGRGVYKSAFKNALRLTRTETNNAYVDAELEYAKQKGYQKMWNVNPGHRYEDECDDLAGKVFDPEEIEDLYPQHPQDACYFTTVIPGIG